MSGHSKWATTKHKKALVDSKRSKAFSKLSNAITIAARSGKDPSHNPNLRDIIAKARALNMPGDNIERAVKRGAGEIPGIIVNEHLIEAYGPGGTALLIRIITDNKNRTLGEIKSVLNKHEARLAESGSVQWMFTEAVCFEVPADQWRRDDLTMLIIDAGAEEIEENNDPVFIFCQKPKAEAIKIILADKKISADSYITYLANNPITINDEKIKSSLRDIVDNLEELDDIDSTYLNADLS